MTAIVPQVIEFPAAPPALARAQAGDHDAFAELVERHEAMVFSLGYHFFSDRGKAEEIAQDVFLQLYRNLSAIESESHLLFWLRQVTTRRCIDLTRRARMKAVSLEDAGELRAADRSTDILRDRRLRQLISELPDLQRAVVTLRYQEDLDPTDIASTLDMPINTVKSHLKRSLTLLRARVQGTAIVEDIR